MDLISFEDTVDYLQQTYAELEFHTKEEVLGVLELLPDKYCLVQGNPDEDEEAQLKIAREQSTKKTSKLASRASEILLFGNTTKANAIESFVETTFNRKLVAIKDLDTNNCLFEAVLTQISNTEFVCDQDGRTFQPNDLRLQCMHYAAVNYEEVFPAIQHYLCGIGFKEWIIRNLESDKESDYAMAVLLRKMLKVSLFYIRGAY